MRVYLRPLLAAFFLITSIQPALAEVGAKDISLRYEVDNAVHKCLTLLAEEQDLDGYWASPDFPGLSALIIRSFLESPVDTEKWQKSDTVAKGIAFLREHVKEDGGIYNRGLYSYNTAISLMCLNVYYQAAEKHGLLNEEELAELKEIMVRAREFVVSQQQFYEEDDLKIFDGGIGYGRSSNVTDLSNTSFALQALHETRHLVDENDEQAVRLNWDAAIQFLTNTQNLPETNSQDWASGDPANRGGFVYRPGDSKAGTFETESGETGHRSYGSMSYAGLMSMIYAGLDEKDSRVLAAMDWLEKHFSLEENPGMGMEGLYYYYHTMSRALTAYGKDKLVLEDGSQVDWRHQLARKLVSELKHPGFWANENSRWMESNPYLVSAYTLLALKDLYPEL
ncbi:MAG TPA: prenyltransferase/squalene oxidase repeat-containing protein [Opitutales bacterium]|nr:prenyltransferase/squalene oxidase repeat-containing protein [Opitutales bacterium]